MAQKSTKSLGFGHKAVSLQHLLSSAVVTVGELGGKGHVELIVGDVTEAAARGRRLLKPGAQHTQRGFSLRDTIQAEAQQNYCGGVHCQSLNQNNLWSLSPMSRQPSRMYRGFRMAAVPEADRIHTSSLS